MLAAFPRERSSRRPGKAAPYRADNSAQKHPKENIGRKLESHGNGSSLSLLPPPRRHSRALVASKLPSAVEASQSDLSNMAAE